MKQLRIRYSEKIELDAQIGYDGIELWVAEISRWEHRLLKDSLGGVEETRRLILLSYNVVGVSL